MVLDVLNDLSACEISVFSPMKLYGVNLHYPMLIQIPQVRFSFVLMN